MIDYSQRPGEHECFDYHRDYVAMVEDGNILVTLSGQLTSIPQFIREIPIDQFEGRTLPSKTRSRVLKEGPARKGVA